MFFEDNIDNAKYCGHLYGLGTTFIMNGNNYHDNGDTNSSWFILNNRLKANTLNTSTKLDKNKRTMRATTVTESEKTARETTIKSSIISKTSSSTSSITISASSTAFITSATAT